MWNCGQTLWNSFPSLSLPPSWVGNIRERDTNTVFMFLWGQLIFGKNTRICKLSFPFLLVHLLHTHISHLFHISIIEKRRFDKFKKSRRNTLHRVNSNYLNKRTVHHRWTKEGERGGGGGTDTEPSDAHSCMSIKLHSRSTPTKGCAIWQIFAMHKWVSSMYQPAASS